jgi:hypothetical protein
MDRPPGENFEQLSACMPYLITGDMGEQRERDNFVGGAFCDGHRLGGKAPIRVLAVTWLWIVNARIDPSSTQQPTHLLPLGYARDV